MTVSVVLSIAYVVLAPGVTPQSANVVVRKLVVPLIKPPGVYPVLMANSLPVSP